MKVKATIALLALLSAGCGLTYGPRFTMNDVDAMRPGVTTFADARKRLGAPLSKDYEPDGGMIAVWLYQYFTASTQEARTVYLRFDQDGKLVQVMGKSESTI